MRTGLTPLAWIAAVVVGAVAATVWSRWRREVLRELRAIREALEHDDE